MLALYFVDYDFSDSKVAGSCNPTDEELDFIIDYDIKYRMGQDGGVEEGE